MNRFKYGSTLGTNAWLGVLVTALSLCNCGGGDDDKPNGAGASGGMSTGGGAGKGGKGGAGGKGGSSTGGSVGSGEEAGQGDSGPTGGTSGSKATGGTGGTAAGRGGAAGRSGSGGSAGSKGGTGGKGGTSGSANNGGSGDSSVEGTPHELTTGGGSFGVPDDNGDIVATVAWSSATTGAVVGTAWASLASNAPDGFEPVAGVTLDFGDIAASLSVAFPVPADANPDDYVMVIDTPLTRMVNPVASRTTSEGGTEFYINVSTNETVVLVKLHPADGCTDVATTSLTYSSDSALDALQNVYRIKGSSSVYITGTGVTTLSALKCLLVVDSAIEISGTDIDSTEGLEALSATDGNNFSNNQLLATASLPSLYAGGVSLTQSPLLEEADFDLLDGNSLTFTNNGSATTGTMLSARSLSRSKVVDIESNPELTGLGGLSALTTVEALTVDQNDGIASLDGLDSLTRAGSISISNNGGLGNVDALASLESVSPVPGGSYSNSNLTINGNALLETIKLPAMTAIGTDTSGTASFQNNSTLHTLSLHKLAQVKSLSLGGNGSGAKALATDFAKLKKLDSLTINGNPGLQDLAGFAALTQVSGTISIASNGLLESFDGLQALASIGGLNVSQNGLLEHIDVFDVLTTATGDISVTGNPVLSSIAFPKLASAAGALSFAGSPLLDTLEVDALKTAASLEVTSDGQAGTALTLSFAKLETVLGDVQLLDNAGLVDVDGLAALHSVNGDLTVYNNSNLTSLDGLSALQTVTKALSIDRNAALETIDFEALERAESITITGNDKVKTIALPAATSVTTLGIGSGNQPLLESVTADALQTLNVFSVSTAGADVTAMTLSFAGLQTVTTSFTLQANPTLASLDGFGALVRVGSFYVASNSKLPTCAATALRDQIQAQHAIGSVTISGNLADTCTP